MYADYRGGKHLMIRIEVCEEDQLNDLEKERISELDPRRRYNMNSGGAVIRPYGGEAIRSTRCRITIKRADTVVNQGVRSTVLLDGKEVKKLRSGEGTKVSTTEGFHRLEVKAFGSRTLSESVDLREGDVIVIRPTLLGWEYRIERPRSSFSADVVRAPVLVHRTYY